MPPKHPGLMREYIVIVKTPHVGHDEIWAVQLQADLKTDAKKAAEELMTQSNIDGTNYIGSQVLAVLDLDEVPYVRATSGFSFSVL